MIKTAIKVIVIVALLVSFVLSLPKEDKVIAVLQMDGKGWYLVEQYRIINNGKCVQFRNGVGQIEKFCGAFGVTERKDFYKLPSKPSND